MTSPYVLEVSEATFADDVLARSGRVPVVVDFWAPWCTPCRTLGPLLERLAAEARGAFVLAKLNVDDNPQLASAYGVQGIPVVKAFRDGQVADGFTGLQPEARVRELIKKVAPTAADRRLVEAQSLLATRHWSAAEAAFREVLADQPTSAPAALGLLKALLALGRGCEAVDLLEDFPRGDAAPMAEKLVVCSANPAMNSLPASWVGGSVEHAPLQEQCHARPQTELVQAGTQRCHGTGTPPA